MSEAAIRRNQIEGWLVECGKDRALFLERERADAYVSTRSEAVVSALVKGAVVVEMAQRLRETLRELAQERGTIVVVKTDEATVRELRGEVTRLQVEIERLTAHEPKTA